MKDIIDHHWWCRVCGGFVTLSEANSDAAFESLCHKCWVWYMGIKYGWAMRSDHDATNKED